jgi:hypothetical protein
LDFKTREELQQMPQTEEEHLENQYLDYEDKEKSIADAEVGRLMIEFPSFRQFTANLTHISPLYLMLPFSLRPQFKGARLKILSAKRRRHRRRY